MFVGAGSSLSHVLARAVLLSFLLAARIFLGVCGFILFAVCKDTLFALSKDILFAGCKNIFGWLR